MTEEDVDVETFSDLILKDEELLICGHDLGTIVTDDSKAPFVVTENEDEFDGPVDNGLMSKSGLSLIGDSDVEEVGDIQRLKELEEEDSSGTSGSGEFSSLEDALLHKLEETQLEQGLAQEEEDEEEINSLGSEEWRTQKRHVFILSESGKPIYSRYGNEDKLVTLFGLMQALVSVVHDDDDMIRSIRMGNVRIVFLIKSPLILVGVSRLNQSIPQMQTQLMYFYNQVVSILTSKQLEQIYEKRRNFDLRRLLAGSERLLTALSDSIDEDPSFLLGAVKCLPLPTATRETIASSIIQHTTKLKDVVFAILLAGNQLVTLVRMKKCFMHPMDLLIIRNLVNASESFRTGENWTPLCLPRFDSSGFVHAHVSYLTDDSEACLILLTVDRESFFALSEAKQKIVEKLRNANCLESINGALRNKWPSMSSLPIPQIRHFIYKSKQIAQFACPTLSEPYLAPSAPSQEPDALPRSSQAFTRLFSAYSKIHARLHSHSRPLRLLYAVGDKENFMGWITSTFELYVAFEPLTKKSVAIAGVEKLLKWVKKEEDRLFITNSPTF